MELKEALLKRRSCRKFLDKKVNNEDIDYLLHAAMSGPSAMNKTPWEFYVIKDETKLKEIKKASLFTGYDAPLAIVVGCDLKRALPLKLKEFWIQDCSAATENILLAATDLGLGSVWCGIYPQEKPVTNLRRILNLKENIVPLNIIYIGYPLNENEPRDQYNEKYIHNI